jgi:hypothetical protein
MTKVRKFDKLVNNTMTILLMDRILLNNIMREGN